MNWMNIFCKQTQPTKKNTENNILLGIALTIDSIIRFNVRKHSTTEQFHHYCMKLHEKENNKITKKYTK